MGIFSKYFAVAIIFLFLTVTCYIAIIRLALNECKEVAKAIDTFQEGNIVAKEMITTDRSVTFRFAVSGEVKYHGEPHPVVKKFIVTEDIYNQFIVGDWFDSQKLTMRGT